MRSSEKTIKKLSQTLTFRNDKNSFAVAVALALVFATVLLGVYYVVLQPDQNEYMTVYLLDTQKKAANYPELLVRGENSTFSVYVEVENHMQTPQNCQVQVKVTSDMNPSFPVPINATQTFSGTVQNEEVWENLATLSLNQAGKYLVVFELWTSKEGIFEYSGNFCVLNVQVVG